MQQNNDKKFGGTSNKTLAQGKSAAATNSSPRERDEIGDEKGGVVVVYRRLTLLRDGDVSFCLT